MRSLDERLAAFEQKKARLADIESRLKLAEKRAHTRRIYAVASLLEKCGLLQEDDETLYGAFLETCEGMKDAKVRGQWRLTGSQALEDETRTEQQGREPIVLTFPTPPAREMASRLKEAGFRYNKILQHWEGVARFEDAEQIASSCAGVASRYGEASRPPPPSELHAASA